MSTLDHQHFNAHLVRRGPTATEWSQSLGGDSNLFPSWNISLCWGEKHGGQAS